MSIVFVLVCFFPINTCTNVIHNIYITIYRIYTCIYIAVFRLPMVRQWVGLESQPADYFIAVGSTLSFVWCFFDDELKLYPPFFVG